MPIILVNLFNNLNQMYTKKIIPLTKDEIKMINARSLAKTFGCTSAYIGKVLNLQKHPVNEKQIQIIETARKIISAYEIKQQ